MVLPVKGKTLPPVLTMVLTPHTLSPLTDRAALAYMRLPVDPHSVVNVRIKAPTEADMLSEAACPVLMTARVCARVNCERCISW